MNTGSSTAISSQIVALQNIVRIQDDLLRRGGNSSDEVTILWRNEAYKASVQRHIIEEETMRIGIALVGQLGSQRNAICASLSREFSRCIVQFENRIIAPLVQIEGRIKRMESGICRPRIARRVSDSRDMVVEDLRARNAQLYDINTSLRQQLESMREQLQEKDRLLRKTMESMNHPKGREMGKDLGDHKTTDDVRQVLKQIRELELQAERILIKE